MLYSGNAAKYQMAERMRQAEQARLASETRVVRERRAKVRGLTSSVLAVLAFPFRH